MGSHASLEIHHLHDEGILLRDHAQQVHSSAHSSCERSLLIGADARCGAPGQVRVPARLLFFLRAATEQRESRLSLIN